MVLLGKGSPEIYTQAVWCAAMLQLRKYAPHNEEKIPEEGLSNRD